MGWLGTRLLKRSSPEDAGPVAIEEPGPEPPSGPPLVLLVPDAAAVSSFRCYTFPGATPAAEFILSAVPWEARRGLHAFWASHEQPEQGPEPGEAMVLIRTAEDSNLMYVVSFVDIASAQSFARFEVKRGLNLGLVTIYWAHLIEIRESGDGITLTPSVPPGETGAGERLAAPEAEEPSGPAAPHPEPATAGEATPREEGTLATPPAAAEAKPTVEAQEPAIAGESLLAEADEEPELDLFADQATAGEAPPAESAPEQAAAEPDVPQGAPQEAAAASLGLEAQEEEPCLAEDLPPAEAVPGLAPEPGVTSASVEPEAPVEPCLADEAPAAEAPRGLGGHDGPVLSFRGDEEEESTGIPAMFALQPPIESAIGDEELVGDAWAFPPALSAAGDEDAGPPGPGDGEDAAAQELSTEIDKILKTRRWEKREDPFKGFGSPPGRF